MKGHLVQELQGGGSVEQRGEGTGDRAGESGGGSGQAERRAARSREGRAGTGSQSCGAGKRGKGSYLGNCGEMTAISGWHRLRTDLGRMTKHKRSVSWS
jgi:hypothetical protein